MAAGARHGRRLVASLLGSALLLASGPSWAQDGGTVVEGTVVDDRTGAPVEDVTVTGVHVEPDYNVPPDAAATADQEASGGATAEQTPLAGACGCPPRPEVAPEQPGIAPRQEDFDQVVTGSDGRFRLDGVAPPAGWSVRVRVFDETDRDFRYRTQELDVEWDGSRPAVIDVLLVRSGQVHGRVVDAETGEPIRGIEVFVSGAGFAQAMTEADGSYVVRDVRPGSYSVRYVTDNARPDREYRSQHFDGAVEESDATPVAVVRGEATIGIDAALVPGASLAGSVVGPDDRPLDAIAVTVFDAATGDRVGGSAATDAAGEWQVDGLAAGEYQVRYRRPPYDAISDIAPAGYAATWAGGSFVREDAEVAVAEVGRLTRIGPTRVVPAGAIRGRLVERVSGVPVTTACVTVVDEAGREVGDGEPVIGGLARGPGEPLLGTYEIDQLPPGTHRVLFETPGCGSGPDDQRSHEPRWHGDASDFEEAAAVPVSSGEVVTGVDGVLDPRPPLGLRAGVVGQVGRVAGPDRVETAIEVARRATAGRGAETVVLARADDYADALAGGPLAARFDAPILLSGGDRLDARVVALVTELAPRTAYLLGGETALTPRVAQELREAGVAEVVRIAGDDRFATAAAIADRVVSQAERERGSPTAYLVEGVNADPQRGWPDALAAAAQGGRPVLLTGRDSLPEATRRALGIFVAVTIVGGEAAVSPEVQREVADEVIEVHRIAGATRYETFRRLSGAAGDRPWLVTGRDWPDALTAGAGAHLDGGSLVLVDGTTAPTGEDLHTLAGAFADLDRLLLIGGPAALSPALEDALRERAAAGPAAG